MRIREGQLLDRVEKLLARRFSIGSLAVLFQEALRVAASFEPCTCLFDMRFVNGFAQPACERKLASINGKFEAQEIIACGERVNGSKVLEYEVAFLNLAFADQPEFFGSIDDALFTSCGEFCL